MVKDSRQGEREVVGDSAAAESVESDRARLDLALIEEQRARLAAIVESSNDAIIGKTMDGIITSWNPAAERLYGYKAEEVVGTSIGILVPPDRPDELPRIMERLRRGERIERFETERIRKDGVRLHVSISISPIRGSAGQMIGAATMARDNTAQVRSEEERTRLLARERQARADAEAAQRRLAFLAEASGVLSASLDYETTLANVAKLAVPYVADWCAIHIAAENGEVHRIAVTHVDSAKIELALEMEQRYPPDPDELTGTYAVLRTGESMVIESVTDEMIVAGAKDEEHLRLIRALGLSSLMIVPLLTRDRIVGVITFAAAESGAHFDSDDLALAEDLANRAATAVDNARLYREAQEALRLRDEFLSIASHELKTPLTALQLQAQLLKRNMRGGTQKPESMQRILDAVERQVRRLTRLTTDLLDISRITSGRFELERTHVDLAVLVREVADRFAEEAAAVRSDVRIHVGPGVAGHWDRHRLDQVLSNLLSNAIKYGRGRPIDVTVDGEDGVAVVRVADRGVGIDRAELDHIFDRFFRIETSERAGGLGLGLYIVREIVAAHGGTVRVESEPDGGSTFTVELPC